MTESREIRLLSRPKGWPEPDNFEIAYTMVAPPGDGQVLVRNCFMSVDPYMRGRMKDAKSYVAPFQLGEPLEGHAIGEVMESRAGGIAQGAIVTSMRGWREYFVADARDVQIVEQPASPLSLHLGALGMPGMTAWAGLELFDVKAGDRVFVSAAAGAVGSIAGQLAKLRGCFVVGSAGSAEKVRALVNDFGFDAAFNYKSGNIAAQLKAAAPDGITMYFDNVGGEHLEAALSVMRPHGRVALCGAISTYNEAERPAGPRNLAIMIGKRITMKGFLVGDFRDRTAEFLNAVSPLVADGRLRVAETIVEGLERAPEAFLSMLRGGNVGKMVVKLA